MKQRIRLLTSIILFAMGCHAQPKDPKLVDVDTVTYRLPGDPSNDPDGQEPQAKILVCDSVVITQSAVILYYRNRIVTVYKKERKPKKGEYSFY